MLALIAELQESAASGRPTRERGSGPITKLPPRHVSCIAGLDLLATFLSRSSQPDGIMSQREGLQSAGTAFTLERWISLLSLLCFSPGKRDPF